MAYFPPKYFPTSLNYWPFAFFSLFLLGACQPHLERKGIPIWMGLTLDEFRSSEGFEAMISLNLGEFDRQQLAGIMIEIPLEADSVSGTPFVSPQIFHHFEKLSSLLGARKIPYGISISPQNSGQHFPNAGLKNPVLWFDSLEHIHQRLWTLSRILSPENPPQRWVVGYDLSPLEKFDREWARLFFNLKNQGYQGKISYGFSIHRFENQPLRALSDEIAITFPSIADENYKKFSRKWIPLVAEKAIKEEKSIFICQANLIGEKKTLQFKNRLRFWGEKVKIVGINLNTLYDYSSLIDTSSYFKLKENVEFEEFFRTYQMSDKNGPH